MTTQTEAIQVAIAALELYQHQDDISAKLLAGFKETPDTIDVNSPARKALVALRSLPAPDDDRRARTAAELEAAKAEIARLHKFIGLETGYDINDPAMNAARYDGYLDGLQVGLEESEARSP